MENDSKPRTLKLWGFPPVGFLFTCGVLTTCSFFMFYCVWRMVVFITEILISYRSLHICLFFYFLHNTNCASFSYCIRLAVIGQCLHVSHYVSQYIQPKRAVCRQCFRLAAPLLGSNGNGPPDCCISISSCRPETGKPTQICKGQLRERTSAGMGFPFCISFAHIELVCL